jgi:hypothetical protein
MRTVQLAKIAAQAEKLRLERMARRQAIRAAFAAVAGLFVLAALCFLHVLVWVEIHRNLGPANASAILIGIDLVIAFALLGFAARSAPSRIEVEAVEVRERAMEQMREAVALTAVVGPLGRVLGRKHIYGLTLAALTARFLSSNRS